mmetsp:Transcript_14689/g.27888  ORF Transcript_14689/g.27888 Transcript_14689/m.27888 type:complete len:92 (-) Transcript_14689:1011-1286(-)
MMNINASRIHGGELLLRARTRTHTHTCTHAATHRCALICCAKLVMLSRLRTRPLVIMPDLKLIFHFRRVPEPCIVLISWASRPFCQFAFFP